MKKKMQMMTCTNCGSSLNVDELLVAQFEKSIRQDLQSEMKRREEELATKKEEYRILAENLSTPTFNTRIL